MNERDKAMMRGYSIGEGRCVFCGRPAGSRHHVVYRSRGGGNGPTFDVCGTDNVTGCHGLLHQHYLHPRFDAESDTWEYLKTDVPMKDEEADQLEGWVKLRRFTR